MPDYRIDDLASAAGMTTRNVRAYQSQGLLPPPRREGRVGLYSEVHLARLRLIGSLLGRGYSAAHITELIGAWEQGRDLSDVLGIERVLATPFGDEVPTYMTTDAVVEVLGDATHLDRAEELGLLRREDSDRVRVERPRLLSAIGELAGMGVPVATAYGIVERVEPLLNQVADTLVGSAVDILTAQQGAGFDPTDEELAALVPTLERMRELALTTVQGSLARSMETSIERVLGDWFHVLRARGGDKSKGAAHG